MNPLSEQTMNLMELEILVAYLDVYNASTKHLSVESDKKKISYTYHNDFDVNKKICDQSTD